MDDKEPESHVNAMRCVLNNMGECIAKIPAACLCMQMPKSVYIDAREKFYPKLPDHKEG